MLTYINELLLTLVPIGVYAALWITSAVAILRRAEWAIYLLVILTPLPTVWYPLHQFPLGNSTLDILMLSTLIGVLINKGGFDRTPSSLLIGSFLLTSYLALWNSAFRFDLPWPVTMENPSMSYWKNYAEMVFLYFLAYHAIRDEKSLKTIVVLMASTLFLVIFRQLRSFSEGSSFSYDRRASGPFLIVGLNANHFGAFITHYCTLVAGLFAVDRHRMRRWLYAGILLACVYPLFFSYSRGAYLATIAGLLIIGLLRKRIILLGFAVLALTWQSVLPATVVERISMTESSSGELEESAALRLVMWDHAERTFYEHPIFGIGLDGFAKSLPEDSRLTDTHNFYLRTAAELGSIGLLLLALVLMRALWSGWRLFRAGHTDFHTGLGLGFIACTVAVIVTNIFGDRWSQFTLGSYFWIFWGLVERARSLSLPQEPAPRNSAALT